jgi:hypothetical protein
MRQPAHTAVLAMLAPSSKPVASAFRNAAILCLLLAVNISWAQQSTPQETPQQEFQRLKQAVDQAQAQVEASQQQLVELKKSLAALEQRLTMDDHTKSASAAQLTASPATAPMPAPVDDLRERQTMQENQIATLDQSKVESDSKYPVKIDGLLLFSGFVNTSQVDVASAPSLAIAGGGSTGASQHQTILGIDARGPRLAAPPATRIYASISSAAQLTAPANQATPMSEGCCGFVRPMQRWTGRILRPLSN